MYTSQVQDLIAEIRTRIENISEEDYRIALMYAYLTCTDISQVSGKYRPSGNDAKKLTVYNSSSPIDLMEIRDIRDNYTIHHSRGINLVVRSNYGYIATTLGKIIDNKVDYTSISNDNLEHHIIMLYSILRSLNSYLSSNLNKISFENKIKKDNKKGITVMINYALLKKMNTQIQLDEKHESQSSFIEFLLCEHFNKKNQNI